jgi:hypothetical protein
MNFETLTNPELLALLYHQSANGIAKEVFDIARSGSNPSGVLQKVDQFIINEATACMIEKRSTFLVTAKVEQ